MVAPIVTKQKARTSTEGGAFSQKQLANEGAAWWQLGVPAYWASHGGTKIM
jgi:hypothetical protein